MKNAERMYRAIVTAQAIRDVFVRATSDTEANRLIERGKGQRTKPRFGTWQLWMEAIAVDAYEASDIPAQAMPKLGLTTQELGEIYMKLQHNISVIRGIGAYTDKERQAMSDAVREFHNMLKDAICMKKTQT